MILKFDAVYGQCCLQLAWILLNVLFHAQLLFCCPTHLVNMRMTGEEQSMLPSSILFNDGQEEGYGWREKGGHGRGEEGGYGWEDEHLVK